MNERPDPMNALTLSLDGALASEFKARIDGVIVDADGAVITLAEGQTSVSFALLEDGEITADMAGSISASYLSPDETADSNVWALSLIDTGEAETTFNGDFLVKTETRNGLPITRLNTAGLEVEVVASGALYYVRDANRNLAAGSEAPTYQNIYVDGNVVGVEEVRSDDVVVNDNTIYGTAGKDAINGLTGNDQINGGAGATRSIIPLSAIYFVAAYARKRGVSGTFDCKKRRKNTKNLPSRCLAGTSNTQSAHAHSSRLVGHKWLGRRMDSAWAVAGLEVG